MNKLYKSTTNKMLCGVCGGLGEYFGIQAEFLRFLVVIFTIFFPITFVIYILMCIFVKDKPY